MLLLILGCICWRCRDQMRNMIWVYLKKVFTLEALCYSVGFSGENLNFFLFYFLLFFNLIFFLLCVSFVDSVFLTLCSISLWLKFPFMSLLRHFWKIFLVMVENTENIVCIHMLLWVVILVFLRLFSTQL